MRVFVTGATGQLGYDCLRECMKRGHEVTGCDTRAAADSVFCLDIKQETDVRAAVEKAEPDVIIHCAAWTDVDAAELPENRETVFAVNADGTANIAKAAKAVGAKMIYISSDYVFDGQGETPWKPDDSASPLNIYGQSKLDGERAANSLLDRLFIVRTSWAFGINGKNFADTMLRIGKVRDTVRVVCDQVGTPTYTADLAGLLLDMAETEKYGCYHAANEGDYISWYEFCCELFRQTGMNTTVVPVSTAEYGQNIAARPSNSRLDKSKLPECGFSLLPDWRNAVARYLREREMNE